MSLLLWCLCWLVHIQNTTTRIEHTRHSVRILTRPLYILSCPQLIYAFFKYLSLFKVEHTCVLRDIQISLSVSHMYYHIKRHGGAFNCF